MALLYKDSSRLAKGIEIKGSDLVACVAESYRISSLFKFVVFILGFSAVSGVHECVIIQTAFARHVGYDQRQRLPAHRPGFRVRTRRSRAERVAVGRQKGIRAPSRPVNGTILLLLLVVAVDTVPRLVRVLSKGLARCPYFVRLPWRIIKQGEGAPDYVLEIAGRREETSPRAVKWAWLGCRSLVSLSLPPSLPPRTSYFPWWIWDRHDDLPSRLAPSQRPRSPRGVWCHPTHIVMPQDSEQQYIHSLVTRTGNPVPPPVPSTTTGAKPFKPLLPENGVNDVPLHF